MFIELIAADYTPIVSPAAAISRRAF